jgi:hypothetical protein
MNKSSNISTQVSLHGIVNSVYSQLSCAAREHSVTVLNEIPKDVYFPAYDLKLATVIKGLLSSVINNGDKTTIHVSADRFRDIIIFRIQDRNNNNGYAMSFSVMAYEPEVVAAGGSLHIEGYQKKVATVSFSFPNPAYA